MLTVCVWYVRTWRRAAQPLQEAQRNDRARRARPKIFVVRQSSQLYDSATATVLLPLKRNLVKQVLEQLYSRMLCNRRRAKCRTQNSCRCRLTYFSKKQLSSLLMWWWRRWCCCCRRRRRYFCYGCYCCCHHLSTSLISISLDSLETALARQILHD